MATKTIEQEARNVQAEAAAEMVAAPECIHHWVIASPNGAMSLGKCKVCGLEREFPNSAEDGLWEREVPQSRWTGRTEMRSWNEGF
ncbi:MAG TPA: hypothetical protein VEZ14_00225 [Dehalococcoidia bacterium]|nr:hypothetical protein [Dehalococcoidia bacterium]